MFPFKEKIINKEENICKKTLGMIGELTIFLSI